MGRRVLVVEDDADLREMMAHLLLLEGFEADIAGDGAEALDKLRGPEAHPDVIVLDMMMPRMDGWSFCREQALEPALADIPVVVVTATPREQLTSLKTAAIVSKPFDYQQLIDTLRQHCRATSR
jgi:CheY-like chemotaxis protein